ncbi:piggyBac transposable element-derived protein 5-like [Patiria miniata]|uniref:PiggyBac transposable element-derived protein domain-containing protein n=1 Tax=Patiria miniata TaxID=46514 RepID=A0A914A0T6_PATMI|nr:piggyBac transposable element-derived protein 5-like [Patiria miniata]
MDDKTAVPDQANGQESSPTSDQVTDPPVEVSTEMETNATGRLTVVYPTPAHVCSPILQSALAQDSDAPAGAIAKTEEDLSTSLSHAHPVPVQVCGPISTQAQGKVVVLPTRVTRSTDSLTSSTGGSAANPGLDPCSSGSGLSTAPKFDYYSLDGIKEEEFDTMEDEVYFEEEVVTDENSDAPLDDESDFSPIPSDEESFSDSSSDEEPSPAKRVCKQPSNMEQGSAGDWLVDWSQQPQGTPNMQGTSNTPQKHSTDRHGWTRSLKDVPVHEFQGRQPYGPTIERPGDDNPLAYFLSFFPMTLFSKMARYTNIVGEHHASFKPTTQAEIKAWIGIRMIQGVHTNVNNEDDWSTHPGLRNQMVASTMTRGRFNLIAEHLTCTNPGKMTKKADGKRDSDPLAPVKLIWNTVNDACKANYNPRRELCLDEVSLKANTRREFFPQLRVDVGTDIYAVCEASSGYLLHMLLHSEVGRKRHKLPLQMMQPFLGRYHQLYCGTQYTSTMLAKDLLVNQTYLCGAVALSSKGLPDDVNNRQRSAIGKDRLMETMLLSPRGTSVAWQQGQMTLVLWRDVKVMSLLSTCHQGYRNQLTDFFTRTIRETGAKTPTKANIPAPAQAVNYMKFKSGVEHSNHLRSYHSCNRKYKAWKRIFFFLIDIARVNAWICYKINTEGKQLNHRMFTVNIATALIAGFAEGTPVYQSTNAAPVPAINGPNHVCTRMKVLYPKMCMQCRRAGRKTKKGKPVQTRTGCSSCNVHLCRGQCFLEFHSVT